MTYCGYRIIVDSSGCIISDLKVFQSLITFSKIGCRGSGFAVVDPILSYRAFNQYNTHGMML